MLTLSCRRQAGRSRRARARFFVPKHQTATWASGAPDPVPFQPPSRPSAEPRWSSGRTDAPRPSSRAQPGRKATKTPEKTLHFTFWKASSFLLWRNKSIAKSVLYLKLGVLQNVVCAHPVQDEVGFVRNSDNVVFHCVWQKSGKSWKRLCHYMIFEN